MQLMTIGESLNVKAKFDDIIAKTSMMSKSMAGAKQQAIMLATGVEQYSLKAIKMAIADTTLNEKQIERILIQKGLTGETLKTTTAELAAITTTNGLSASQKKATGTTSKLGLAIKGLGASLLNFVKSPIGIATIIAGTIGLVYNAVKKHEQKLEEQKQKIHELGETARSEFQSIQDSLKSTVSRVNEVKDRYAELAQGVENLGKSNQSRGKLSTEDYEEFLSISNELSSLMPDLTKTYDDNGNAILNLNGDIQTITNSLNDFIEAQKRMAAQDMFTKMPDIYSDYRQTVSEYADKYNNSQDKANIY